MEPIRGNLPIFHSDKRLSEGPEQKTFREPSAADFPKSLAETPQRVVRDSAKQLMHGHALPTVLRDVAGAVVKQKEGFSLAAPIFLRGELKFSDKIVPPVVRKTGEKS
ncbi:MAG: hypothetical protein WB791_00625 [Waddliaceae bacterium]